MNLGLISFFLLETFLSALITYCIVLLLTSFRLTVCLLNCPSLKTWAQSLDGRGWKEKQSYDFLRPPYTAPTQRKCESGGDGLAVKSTCLFTRELEFDFQHPHSSTQQSSTPVPRGLSPPSGLHRHQICKWCTNVCTGKTYIKNKIEKIE